MKTVTLDICEFDKTLKVLKLTSEHIGMPAKFSVCSHRTGKVVEFNVVQPGDSLFDEDQYDGEQQIYRPVEHLNNVEYLVIYNQY